MAFLVTIIEEDNTERSFLINDDVEIVPLSDIEAEQAAFALGFTPSSALVYYIAYEWSALTTVMELLGPEDCIAFMVSCIERIFPIIEEEFTKEIGLVNVTLDMATRLATEPGSFYHRKDLIEVQEAFKRIAAAQRRQSKEVVSQQRPAWPRAFRRSRRGSIRGLIAISLFKLLDIVGVVSAMHKDLLPRKTNHQHEAYHLAIRCQKVLDMAGGDVLAEEIWQVNEVLRLALAGAPERSFSYEVTFRTASGKRHEPTRVTGLLSEVE